MYTYEKRGRGCFVVVDGDGDGVEVTRYGYESDAKFFTRALNDGARSREERAAEADRAMVADMEEDGLL